MKNQIIVTAALLFAAAMPLMGAGSCLSVDQNVCVTAGGSGDCVAKGAGDGEGENSSNFVPPPGDFDSDEPPVDVWSLFAAGFGPVTGPDGTVVENISDEEADSFLASRGLGACSCQE